MLCWHCISIYACNQTNLMHCLSSVYSVTTPLHVSGLLVANHQEVTVYICDSWYVLYWKEDCLKLLECLHVSITTAIHFILLYLHVSITTAIHLALLYWHVSITTAIHFTLLYWHVSITIAIHFTLLYWHVSITTTVHFTLYNDMQTLQ
jgi:hypothetical protein